MLTTKILKLRIQLLNTTNRHENFINPLEINGMATGTHVVNHFPSPVTIH